MGVLAQSVLEYRRLESSITLIMPKRQRRPPGEAQLHPQLLVALECDRPLAASLRCSLAHVDEVVLGRGRERSAERTKDGEVRRLTVRVPDPWMSSTHARLVQVMGRWVLEDAGSRNGTVLNGVRHERGPLGDGDLCELGHTLFLFREAVPTDESEAPDLDAGELRPPAPGLATLVEPLERQFAALETLAASSVSVLLQGESGTGKEVVARAIHGLSNRTGDFVAVNCGALPEHLVESELFGHRKGAFTGALEEREGLVRAAHGGTLFLDEIGDLPAVSQAAFLRVLQEQEVVPIGATRPVKVDLRLIAASHRNLELLVANGRFRADLLARITGFTLHLPALRMRREDLGLIMATLLTRILPEGAEKVTFSAEAARALYQYEWPLNVRELEKALTTAVVLARGQHIEFEHLPETLRGEGEVHRPGAEGADNFPLSSEEIAHRAELIALLREHGGNVSAIARVLGKARMQVHRWLRRYGIEPDSFRR
jgi:DNA-binding NtrC family response regulator